MFSWSDNDPPPYNRKGGSDGKKTISRAEHLSSLLNDPVLKPSTRKVSRDDTTYDTVFQTKDQNALILRTYFSQSNSSTASLPKLSMVGIQATHPWLDSKMKVTGYSPMSNEIAWNNSGLSLGKAVNEIVQHFQFHPPKSITFIDKSLLKIQPKMKNGGRSGRSGSSMNNGNGRQMDTVFDPPPPPPPSDVPPEFEDELRPDATIEAQVSTVMSTLDIPDVPKAFPNFDNLDTEELKELLNDQNKHQAKIEQMKLPCITKTESIKKSLLNGNVKMANKNLSKESSLTSLYSEVQSLQEKLRNQVSKFEELQSKQQELCKPRDTKEIIRTLKVAKRDTFDESEHIASEWLNSSGDKDDMTHVDEFLKSFIQIRTIHHVRAAKMECLDR